MKTFGAIKGICSVRNIYDSEGVLCEGGDASDDVLN